MAKWEVKNLRVSISQRSFRLFKSISVVLKPQVEFQTVQKAFGRLYLQNVKVAAISALSHVKILA